MQVYHCHLKAGISRTTGFEKKGLAQYAVNVGLKCGHGCSYCSSGAMLRIQLKRLGVSPAQQHCCVVDPDSPERVARDAAHKTKRGLIQLCTTVDAWAPEAQQYDLGRRCLEVILSQPGWTVRILTKNAAVLKDFDVIEKYRDRVLLGMSLTALPEKQPIIDVIEPNASPIHERIKVMKTAQALGFRTYGMLCPLLADIADNPSDIDALVQQTASFGAEELFAEPVNARGNGLKQTEEALKTAGFYFHAAGIESIRSQHNWSYYVRCLVKRLQHSVRQHSDVKKLRFLLYSGQLDCKDLYSINQDTAGIVWL